MAEITSFAPAEASRRAEQRREGCRRQEGERPNGRTKWPDKHNSSSFVRLLKRESGVPQHKLADKTLKRRTAATQNSFVNLPGISHRSDILAGKLEEVFLLFHNCTVLLVSIMLCFMRNNFSIMHLFMSIKIFQKLF